MIAPETPVKLLLADHALVPLPRLEASVGGSGTRPVLWLHSRQVKETCEKIQVERPRLVVLQPLSSALDGSEVRHVVEACESAGRPLLLLVVGETVPLPASLAAGVSAFDDFVVRPYSKDLLELRIQLLLRRAAQIDQLESSRRSLEEETITDFKTGLHNDRYFYHRLREEVARSRRHSSPLALALFDFDNFKRINDHFNHMFGDFVLMSVAQTVRREIRSIDIPARLGGDEFALLLPSTESEDARRLGTRLKEAVAACTYEHSGCAARISLSIGIDCLSGGSEHEPEEFLRRADHALLAAKKRGKNCILLFSDLQPPLALSKSGGLPGA